MLGVQPQCAKNITINTANCEQIISNMFFFKSYMDSVGFLNEDACFTSLELDCLSQSYHKKKLFGVSVTEKSLEVI